MWPFTAACRRPITLSSWPRRTAGANPWLEAAIVNTDGADTARLQRRRRTGEDLEMAKNDHTAFVMRDRNNWHPPAYAPGYKTSVARSPRQALMALQTPGASELSGPDFGHLVLGQYDNDLLKNYRQGTDRDGL